eukprot:1158902-Pelagomonas_calceolata.AAC.8
MFMSSIGSRLNSSEKQHKGHERIVLSTIKCPILVESSCQPETPQCFLLTPKLLPGLPMGEGITVLNIMNGPSIDNAVIATSNRHMGYMLYGKRWDCQQPLQPAVAAG